MKTKGIILAGGAGTRLYPLTNIVCKQLLPLYDKPMIYYPLSTLLLAGITDILIISTPQDIPQFKKLLGDGSQLGCKFEYIVQEKPKGIADAFILGADFIGLDQVCLILGDNIFYGNMDFLRDLVDVGYGPTIFAYRVSDPERYGIVEFFNEKNIISIEEKPTNPKSNYAVPGLYVYGSDVVDVAKNLKPSARGEIEITDINKQYLERGVLQVQKLPRGMAWLDTGTHQSLLDASNFIETIETRQGLKFGCIEEIAFNNGYIGRDQLKYIIKHHIPESQYRDYLKWILKEDK